MSDGVRTYLFETTHLAMWAEDVARERSIPAEVVPAPPEAEDKCGMALRVKVTRAEELQTALDDEGVAWEAHAG